MSANPERDRWMDEVIRHLYRTEELHDSDDSLAASQAQSARRLLVTLPTCLAPRRVRRGKR